jgi:hypothetical protein
MDRQPSNIDLMLARIERATELIAAAQAFGATIAPRLTYIASVGIIDLTVTAHDGLLPHREIAAWQIASGSIIDKYGSRGAAWNIERHEYSHDGKPLTLRVVSLKGELDGIVLHMVEPRIPSAVER